MVIEKHAGRRRCAGQSMTEFTIVLAILAPLLLALPAISKLFEVKNKATHMARLSAWQPHDTRGGSGSTRTDAVIQTVVLSPAEIDRFVAPLEQEDVAWDPMLIADDPMITSTVTQFQQAQSNDSLWMSGMEKAVKLVGITGFPLEAKGIETHQVQIAAQIPKSFARWLDLDTSDSTFDYNLSLFSDSWRSDSPADQVAIVSTLTPASLLPKDSIQSFLKYTTGFMPWASAWKTLKLGRIDPGVVPSQSVIQVAP